jgi:cardiolipin synthase
VRREEGGDEGNTDGVLPPPAAAWTAAPAATPAARPPAPPATTWADAGWSRSTVLTLPNGLSAARLLSAPVLAHLIAASAWPAAAALLATAAVSDWADGAAARSLNQGSVLGTYLDPVADKAVVCAVAGSLAGVGALPPALAALIIGRDVALVVGAVAGRTAACGGAWPGGPEFFRLVPPPVGGQGAAAGASAPPPSPAPSPPARAIRPLPLSKLNTALQFGLAGAAIGTAWGGWPGEGVVEGLAWAVGGATAGSGGQYAWAAWKGRRRG